MFQPKFILGLALVLPSCSSLLERFSHRDQSWCSLVSREFCGLAGGCWRVQELQRLFHRQVTRLEDERTEEPPSAGLYGAEIDATTSLQATALLKARLAQTLAMAHRRAPDAMDSTE